VSTPNDYSADEWQAITAAPLAAGLAVAYSDGTSRASDASDVLATERAIARSTIGDAPELVKLVRSVNIRSARDDLAGIPANDREQQTERLIAIIGTAVRAVQRKSPAEVEPFKAWLASVAAKVFHAPFVAGLATTVGGSINHRERDVIDRLSDVLCANPDALDGPKTARPTRALTPSSAARQRSRRDLHDRRCPRSKGR
jgi:hypothetical protein